MTTSDKEFDDWFNKKLPEGVVSDYFRERKRKMYKSVYDMGRASMLKEIREKMPSEIEISRESGRKGMILEWLKQRLFEEDKK